MRIFTNGFEFPSVAGNSIGTGNANISIVSLVPRQTSLGNGGSRHLQIDSNTPVSCPFTALPYDEVETYFKVSQRIEGFPTLLEYRFFDGVTEVFRLSSAGGGPFDLYVGGALEASGSLNLFSFVWQEVEIYSLIDASGTITVSLDGLVDINYSGDTTTGSTSWDNFDIYVDGKVYFDDLLINDTYTVLKYDGGNGTTPTGTVTGGVSSGTIIYHVGDGTDGYMVINNSGTAFSDNDSLSATGFTGNAFGDEEVNNITAPSTTSFVQVFLPDGNGNTSGLTGTDGNSVDNYEMVNDLENVSDAVRATSAGLYDTYTIENIPGDALGINFVEVCFYSRKDGSAVNYQRSVVRHSSIDYPSQKQLTTSSYSWNKFPYQVNPGTDSDWTILDINLLEIGPEVEG